MSLTGSWVKSNNEVNIVVTFDQQTSKYLLAQYEPNGKQNGIEYGTYIWDPATGNFLVDIEIDTNGDWGFDNLAGPMNLQIINDSQLAFTAEGEPLYLTNTRQAGNPISGGWTNGLLMDQEKDSAFALTLLDNGYFMFAEATYNPDSEGGSGLEWGQYTWDSSSGAFDYTVLADTNGSWGLSHADIASLAIGPDGMMKISIPDLPDGYLPVSPVEDTAGLVVEGTSGNDVLEGSTGNDTIYTGLGNDSVDGGNGVDTVGLPLFPNEYEFTRTGDSQYTAKYLDFTTIIDNVEYVEFGTHTQTQIFIDKLVSGDVQTNLAYLADLYLAFFGRAPEVEGFEYWQKNILEGVWDFAEISKRFSWEPEAQALFPPDGDNRNFVQTVYQNTFGRNPDQSGWDYWTDKLNKMDPQDPEFLNDRGSFVGELILGAYAPTSGEEDRTLLTNRHEVALSYVNKLSIQPEELYNSSINDLLAMVGMNASTRESAQHVIDYVFEDEVSLSGVMNNPVLLDALWDAA